LSILLGKTVPLKLGFVGVVSRSQQDIVMGKPIKKMLEEEEKFFKNHPIYNVVAGTTLILLAEKIDQCGTKYLAKKCNRLLSDHIHRVLPALRSQIRKKIKDKQVTW
jgi:dynamin 1-like protein